MTNSEILEFLENSQVQLQLRIDESFAKLQPKLKNTAISEAQDLLLCSDHLTPHAKSLAYLLVCESLIGGVDLETNDSAPNSFRFQLNDLASLSGWSLTTVKRNIHQLLDEEIVKRCPKKHGWYICSL